MYVATMYSIGHHSFPNFIYCLLVSIFSVSICIITCSVMPLWFYVQSQVKVMYVLIYV